MDTKMMSQFSVMDTEMLACVEGGGCNWGDFAKAGVGGAAVVAALGCAAGGVKYGKILGPWGAAIGGIGGAVVCGYLAYTATS
ncbi:bacteriocin-like peptide BlpK [Streptococcus pneumoniae]|uniref:Bacteriocin BlpK n=5 Tax=Streptococcus pneumoniae TaxID=1313 RepID=A7XHC5_STREE|nr:bacteriocin-like peptide BlpK [Streptococcus pneumoniae]EHD27893.1 bacteriocin-type signal sequence domain protein [Streptococcus pneumoniae 4027-06]EHD32301.1 bacteriocin-type signal sequence domain protein [Streptococcus pneumoniae 6735-05]EHD32939.1 bacteriocin-type signal sequence domain protein [Streptococcus pneumoniae GA11184]EHD43188.1 bacteriocin-type signal sequence domain protein [Streptococcus pneumoniae GA43265]EHD50797.1 bacteriocin-type signal sequence domain protein [Strepto